MTKTKNTKRALFASVLSMMLCMAMLVGSTFAWFTDSVTSGVNRIVAGNLDVELYHTNGNVTTEEKVGTDTILFKNKDSSDVLWEPGVMVYENFTVKNIGSLALKYKLTLNAECNTVDGVSLKDVLKVAILDEAFSGDRADAQDLTFDKTVSDFERTGNIAAKAADDTYAVVIYWEPSDKDNEYNFNNDRKDLEKLYIDLGVTLFATQDIVESDSFNNQYDLDAEIPDVVVSSTAALRTAIANAEAGSVIFLTSGTYENVGKLTVNKDLTIMGDANVEIQDIQLTVTNSGALTLENLSITEESYVNILDNTSLTVDNCDVNVDLAKDSRLGNNSSASFIVLNTGEATTGVSLTITNSTFTVDYNGTDGYKAHYDGSNNDTWWSYPAVVFGWNAVKEAVITGNTFGSEEVPLTYAAVKLMNYTDGATVDFSNNTVYGTTKYVGPWADTKTDYPFFTALALYQNNTRANQFSATLSNNTVKVKLENSIGSTYDDARLVYLEVNYLSFWDASAFNTATVRGGNTVNGVDVTGENYTTYATTQENYKGNVGYED